MSFSAVSFGELVHNMPKIQKRLVFDANLALLIFFWVGSVAFPFLGNLLSPWVGQNLLGKLAHGCMASPAKSEIFQVIDVTLTAKNETYPLLHSKEILSWNCGPLIPFQFLDTELWWICEIGDVEPSPGKNYCPSAESAGSRDAPHRYMVTLVFWNLFEII